VVDVAVVVVDVLLQALAMSSEPTINAVRR
jgi:hypothetical protein